MLSNLRSLQALPTSATVISNVTGLLNEATLTCSAHMGNNNSAFDVGLGNGTQSSLVAPCIAASTLRIKNSGGQCLQVLRPQASQLELSGSGNMDVMLDPLSLPSRININNLTASGQDTTTIITLYFSTFKGDAQRIRPGSITVTNRVAYSSAVKLQSFLVLMGCGVNKIAVDLQDGVSAYQVVNICRARATVALADMLKVRSATPCTSVK